MLHKNPRGNIRLVRVCQSLLVFGLVAVSPSLLAQTRAVSPTTATTERRSPTPEPGELADLLRLADSVNPAIIAARNRAAGARARIGPAAAWPDPMVMAGIQNLPLGKMSAQGVVMPAPPGDDMTMKMIGVSQTIPFPGKAGLRRQIAEREVDAAVLAVQSSSHEVERDVKKSYFELAYLDRAIGIVNQNQPVLADVIRVAETHYAAGLGGQQDVLKARVEAARLGETASALLEQRRSALAELNALLDRESATPVRSAQIPERVTRAALASDPARIRFVTQTLGSRAADSPLPSLATLQELALNQNAQLRQRQALIAAQSARVGLAGKAVKPDIDFSLQYGQRTQRPDMISAVVSIPLPIHKRARQDQEISEARSELAAMQAERTGEVNKVRAEVARLASDLERNRTQLALYAKAILPQGQAAVSSSLASYQAGKSDLLSVLDNQATLFGYETANYRALTDFAKTLADLEAVVGGEVLP
jgi:cobalt-zinc-cadmium efflux system outer membrane protein